MKHTAKGELKMPRTIQELYRQFNPLEPLGTNDPRYVDCNKERGIPDLFSQLLLPLTDAPKPLLFSGHLGDGKTTILRQLQGELEKNGDFVAFGEADKRMDLSDVEYDDVLLAILATADQALRQRYQQDTETGAFRQLWEELSRIANLPVDLDKIEVSAGPFAKMTATVKDAPDVRLQVRQNLRQARGPTFLDVVNEYFNRAQELVKKRGHRQLVVILDNLDRVLETPLTGNVHPDEQLFLGQRTQLLGVQCHVIYTVRLALVRSQATNLQAQFGQPPVIVPMIPVRKRDGTLDVNGMARLRDIIEHRLKASDITAQNAFVDAAIIDKLASASGGHLRDLMALVRGACAFGMTAHQELPLTEADAEAAINQLSAHRQMVAIDYDEDLRKVAQTKSLANLDDERRQYLLRHRLVYEYFDGRYWYDISPLLRE